MTLDALFTLDPSTGARHSLGAGDRAVWSPDGRRVAYVHGNLLPAKNGHGLDWYAPFGDPRLIVVNSDGTGRRTLARESFFGAGAGEDYFPLGWTPDGREILVRADDGLASVTGFVDLQGRTRSFSGDSGPLSPRGDELAYVLNDVDVILAGTSDAKTTRTIARLVPAGRLSGELTWSPDDRMLAFSSCDSDGYSLTNCAIYVVGRDGHGLRALARGKQPSWRPGS